MGSGGKGNWRQGGDWRGRARDGPDTGSYRLAPGTAHGEQGLNPLAGGEHPIAFIRTANKGYADHGFDFSNRYSQGTRAYAEEFPALYLETAPSQLPIRTEVYLQMNWTNEQAFEVAVHGFIAEQRAGFGILAGQLAARGYLTVDEASKVRLILALFANDARQHDRTPLPNIGEWARDPK